MSELHVVPGPLGPEFSVKPEDVRPVRSGPWQSVGDWKWREFGHEIQMRNKRLPHLTFDMFRVEAEALFVSLGLVLSKPAPLPYRASVWERFKMWLARKTWNRRNAAMLDEHRKALIEDMTKKLERDGAW